MKVESDGVATVESASLSTFYFQLSAFNCCNAFTSAHASQQEKASFLDSCYTYFPSVNMFPFFFSATFNNISIHDVYSVLGNYQHITTRNNNGLNC